MLSKVRALMLVGCLAMAPSAFAIPLGVEIAGGAGEWSLSGPTSEGDGWVAYYSKTFDISPGTYSWSIYGHGVLGAAWSLWLDGELVHSDFAYGLFFKIDDDFKFVAERVAVPEPGMLALFGIGLAGLGFGLRRKNLKA